MCLRAFISLSRNPSPLGSVGKDSGRQRAAEMATFRNHEGTDTRFTRWDCVESTRASFPIEAPALTSFTTIITLHTLLFLKTM